MRFQNTALLALCGVGFVKAHDHHHHRGEEVELPLHERQFKKDSVEELERKWGFEVCSFPYTLFVSLL